VAIIGVIFYNAIDGTPASYADAFTSSLIYLGITGLTLTLLVQLLPRAQQEVAAHRRFPNPAWPHRIRCGQAGSCHTSPRLRSAAGQDTIRRTAHA
jgi:hypothetical protein